jgi:hypothetical protein
MVGSKLDTPYGWVGMGRTLLGAGSHVRESLLVFLGLVSSILSVSVAICIVIIVEYLINIICTIDVTF